MGAKSKTILGFLWVLSGNGIRFFSKIIVLAILARLLTPEDFGLISTALIFLSFSEIFSRAGLRQALVQKAGINDLHIKTSFLTSAFLGLFFLLVLNYLSSYASLFFSMPLLENVLKVLSLVFIFHGFSAVGEALLEKELEFKKIMAINSFSYIFGYGFVAIVLALKGFGVWALVIAILSQAALKCLMIFILKPHPKLGFSFISLKELIPFGFGYTLGKLPSFLAVQGDNFIVSRFLGIEAIGFYSRAYQLLRVPVNLLGQALEKVLFPSMSRFKGNKDKLVKAFKSGATVMAFLILPISFFVWVLASEIINVFLGVGWENVVFPFQVFAIGMYFRTGYKISDAVCKAVGMVYKRALIKLLYAASVIFGAFIGHFWGINGVAVGVFFGMLVHFLLLTNLSLIILGLSWKEFMEMHIPVFIFSTFVLFLVYFLRDVIIGFITSDVLIILICMLLVFSIYFLALTKFRNYMGEEIVKNLDLLRSSFFQKINFSKCRNKL